MRVRLTTLSENTAGTIGFTGEWGLSILVEAGGEKVLLDTGFSDSLLRNAVAAGVNLDGVNKIVLSHGHTDHTGGLRLLLQVLRKKVEIYAHPDIWDKKFTMYNPPGHSEGAYRYIGVPFCREELEGLGGAFKLSAEPVWINDCMVTTGTVPMVTAFEKIDSNMYVKKDAGYIPDMFTDDQSLAVKTEKGLVVVLGCAHRGMINTITQAQKITGVEQVHAVVGGTHLIRAGENQLNETIAALRRLDVQKVGVSHCTGLVAASVLARELGDRFFYNNAGTVVEL